MLQCAALLLYWYSLQGALHFIYSVSPHVVVSARAADGACVQTPHVTDYAPLADLAAQGSLKLHGSGTALRYDRGGAERYLALFHSLDGEGRYSSFAYTFAAAPPFQVLSVSAVLPLQGSGGRNFASGLLLAASKVCSVVWVRVWLGLGSLGLGLGRES